MSTEPELESYRSGVRVLGIVAIVVATLWLAAFALFALVGTLGGMGVLDPHESQGERMAGVAGSIVVCGLAALGAAVNLTAGIGLRRFTPWGRTAGFVAAVMNVVGGCGCVIGIALGIWMLVTLLDSRAARAFAPAGDAG